MKHIKTFEQIDDEREYLFNIGDHVRFKDGYRPYEGSGRDIFRIEELGGYEPGTDNYFYWGIDITEVDPIDMSYLKEEELELVPDFEVSALKYNI